MKRLIIAFMAGILATACVSHSKYSKVIPDDTSWGYLPNAVEYKTWHDVLDGIYNNAKTEKWDSTTLKSKIAENKAALKNGCLIIKTSGSSSYDANPANWLYVLQDNAGNEVYSEYGHDQIPDATTSQNGPTTWHAVDALYVPDHMTEPFKLIIKSPGSGTITGYTIYADKAKAPK